VATLILSMAISATSFYMENITIAFSTSLIQ